MGVPLNQDISLSLAKVNITPKVKIEDDTYASVSKRQRYEGRYISRMYDKAHTKVEQHHRKYREHWRRYGVYTKHAQKWLTS